MLKSALLDAIRTAIHKHDLDTFQNGDVVVPGCPKCHKTIYTVPQFIDHLMNDVLPPLLDRLSSETAVKCVRNNPIG